MARKLGRNVSDEIWSDSRDKVSDAVGILFRLPVRGEVGGDLDEACQQVRKKLNKLTDRYV